MNLLRFSPGAGQRGTEVVRIIIDFLARSWQDRTTPMEKEAAFPNDAPSGWGGTQMPPCGQQLRSLADVLSRCVGSDSDA